jgi:hypothetical protein
MKYHIVEIGFEAGIIPEDRLIRLLHDTYGTKATVNIITDEVTKLRRVVGALFDESDTRIPKGFDQKSDDYASKVAAHNTALTKLARALTEVGYRE